MSVAQQSIRSGRASNITGSTRVAGCADARCVLGHAVTRIAELSAGPSAEPIYAGRARCTRKMAEDWVVEAGAAAISGGAGPVI